MKETWYQWKQKVDCDGEIRLLNVQRNKFEDEISMGDALFATPEEAKQSVIDNACQVECLEHDWVLVKTTYELLSENDAMCSSDHKYRRYYQCSCGHEWNDCLCNDKCPKCNNKEIEPYDYEEIDG